MWLRLLKLELVRLDPWVRGFHPWLQNQAHAKEPSYVWNEHMYIQPEQPVFSISLEKHYGPAFYICQLSECSCWWQGVFLKVHQKNGGEIHWTWFSFLKPPLFKSSTGWSKSELQCREIMLGKSFGVGKVSVWIVPICFMSARQDQMYLTPPSAIPCPPDVLGLQLLEYADCKKML